MIELSTALETTIQELSALIQIAKPAALKKSSTSLYVSRIKNHDRYYVSDPPEKGTPRKQIYLAKDKIDVAKAIAQGDYAAQIYELASKQLRDISKLHATYDPYALQNIYEDLVPGKQHLIDPYVISDKSFAEEWQRFSYQGNPREFGDSNFLTSKNERVRSKSEMIIADRLASRQIPYRYEAPLIIDEFTILYPDFTILNVRTREVLYWEHFGKMDDSEYVHNFLSKLDLYFSVGILPGKNLLFTYETAAKPLNARHVTRLIEEFLV